MKKSTFKLAFCSLVAALSVALMFLTGLIPVGTYAAPCMVGIFLCAVVIESGYAGGFAVYAVVSVLSFLISADKEAVLYYIGFLGLYPILKGLIERIRFIWLQYIIKLVFFNAAMIAIFYIGIFVLGIPKESFNLFGVYLPWVFLVIGNAVFFIYDICATRLISLYIMKWREKLRIK